jgi:hypothetical protein
MNAGYPARSLLNGMSPFIPVMMAPTFAESGQGCRGCWFLDHISAPPA